MCMPDGSAMPCIPITAHASGTTNGMRMAIVPQLVPVVNAVIEARIKTMAGIKATGSAPASNVTRYAAVFSAAVTSDNDQARTRIIMPNNVARNPPYQASTVSWTERIPWPIVIAAATSTPTKLEYIIDLYGSVVARMSVKVAPWPSVYILIARTTISVIIGTNALTARSGIFPFGANSSPSSAGRASSLSGLTIPLRARTSALYIGPKSSPDADTSNTNMIASIG